jgi:hypothetical protein
VLARVNLKAPRRPTISLPRQARKVKRPDAVGVNVALLQRRTRRLLRG